LQVHVLLPMVLEQFALVLHPPLLVKHSLTSVHVTPFPVYPGLQVQTGEPFGMVQSAVDGHPPFSVEQLDGVQV